MHWKNLLIGIGVLFGAILGFSGSAYAHNLSASDYTYWSPDSNCTRVESALIHDINAWGGLFRAKVQSKKFDEILGWACLARHMRNPNQLQAEVFMWKWDPESNVWGVCGKSKKKLNKKFTAELSVRLKQAGYPLCNDGSYITQAYGFVWFNNQWYPSGGGLWSPVHYLPQESAAP